MKKHSWCRGKAEGLSVGEEIAKPSRVICHSEDEHTGKPFWKDLGVYKHLKEGTMAGG